MAVQTRPESANPEVSNRPRYLAETIKPETGESFDWHAHDFGQLISAEAGSMTVGTPDRVLLLSPAMAVWIPPDMDHWMRYGPNDVMIYVDVDRQEADRLGGACRVVAMTPLLRSLFIATMPEETDAREHRHNDAVHTLLRHEWLSARDVPLSLVVPQDRRVSNLARATLDDPGKVQSVEAWLAEVPASRKTIERIFISETGMPPSRWLRHARILHAVSMLAAGQKITTVALELGYRSSSAFSYMFRQVLGESPSAFLRK